MKFKSQSLPEPSQGVSFIGIKDEVVPDQSLSLQEILQRFTRGEKLPIGHEGHFDENADEEEALDYEKLANSDLTDKEEMVNELRDIQRQYDKEEKARKRAEAKALKEEKAKENLADDHPKA